MNDKLKGLNENLNNEIFTIYSMVDKSLFLNKTDTNDIILSKKNDEKNQKWCLKYDASKDAYLILSEVDNSLVLTLEYPSLKIIAKKLESLENQYWFIKTQVDSKNFTLINYKNPNLCLSISDDKSLFISTINTSNNIKFNFRQPIIDEINGKTLQMKNKLSDLWLKAITSIVTVGVYNDLISNFYSWTLESVDDVFGIFKIKSKAFDKYLNCPDRANLNLISKELTDTQSAKWKIHYGNSGVIRIENIANSSYLCCNENKELVLINSNSTGAGGFWGIREV